MIKDDDRIVMPQRATSGSAGYDFRAPARVTVKPGEYTRIDTGIRFDGGEHPEFSGTPVDRWVMLILPRSSMGMKYGMRMANTVGVIDMDYRDNIVISITSETEFSIEKGERFAQGIIVPFGILPGDATTTVRTGGMGSTGRS